VVLPLAAFAGLMAMVDSHVEEKLEKRKKKVESQLGNKIFKKED